MESIVRSDQTKRSLAAETRIGLSVAALAVAAMVLDHLIPGDPVAFLVTSALALAVAAAIFGHVIPRIQANPAASTLAASRGAWCSLLAVLSIPTLFVGLPFARRRRRRVGTARARRPTQASRHRGRGGRRA